MKKLYIAIGAIILLTIGAVAFALSNQNDTDTIKVTSSIYPVYDLTRQLAENTDIELEYVLPIGVSPHEFSPTASDQQKLDSTDLMFIIGNEFDTWSEDAAESIDSEVKIVTLDQNIDLLEYEDHGHEDEEHSDEENHNEGVEGEEHSEEENHNEDEKPKDDEHSEGEEHNNEESHSEEDEHGHGEYDPHYWLSVDNAITMSESIKDELVELDPSNESTYQENYDNLISSLEELKSEIEEARTTIEGEEIITFHSAFNYLAEDLGVEVVATIEEFPGQTPSPSYIAETAEKAEEYNVQVLFKEPQLSDEIVTALAEDFGLRVETLDPVGGAEETDTYQNLIRYNVDQILISLN